MTDQQPSDPVVVSTVSPNPDMSEQSPPHMDDVADEEMSEMLAAEIEIELDEEDLANDDFQEAVRKALTSVDGELLFQVHADHAEDYRHVAAISIGNGDARKLALIIVPADSMEARIEPAEESANPFAPIARSYASLVDAYQAAA